MTTPTTPTTPTFDTHTPAPTSTFTTTILNLVLLYSGKTSLPLGDVWAIMLETLDVSIPAAEAELKKAGMIPPFGISGMSFNPGSRGRRSPSPPRSPLQSPPQSPLPRSRLPVRSRGRSFGQGREGRN